MYVLCVRHGFWQAICGVWCMVCVWGVCIHSLASLSHHDLAVHHLISSCNSKKSVYAAAHWPRKIARKYSSQIIIYHYNIFMNNTYNYDDY